MKPSSADPASSRKAIAARRRVRRARVVGQAVQRRAGEPVAGRALQGERQPAPRFEPAAQPLGQAGALVQLVPRDRSPILDQEPAVTLLVPEDLLLAPAERG